MNMNICRDSKALQLENVCLKVFHASSGRIMEIRISSRNVLI